MNQTHIVAFGLESKRGDLLKVLALDRGAALREVRHEKACLNLFRRHGPGLLVLRVGKDLEKEMTLLARMNKEFPGTAILVVGDSPNPWLEALAWDLGAAFVLFPPTPGEMYADVVLSILRSFERN